MVIKGSFSGLPVSASVAGEGRSLMGVD